MRLQMKMRLQMQTKQTGTLIVELRKTNRYRLSAPAIFWWARPDGQSQGSEGVTRDLSTAGVFVVAGLCPPVGARVQLDILLPRMNDTAVGVRLHGEGLVLRVERGGTTTTGFAASVQFYPEAPDESVLWRTGSSGRPQ
jgi:hypothetical protein